MHCPNCGAKIESDENLIEGSQKYLIHCSECQKMAFINKEVG